ncbi:SdrD B-like domain-containing protein [Lentzea sp. BCCO 10_0856]|uniref:SdrD B-like domain-containing protein n=1 Tax=Lentzea miocenica TaxID=3095431 RepID=A0ABU4SYU4_9PSEU|nr:SdrD B-like domain-containing protein [Lentzea sp. BCCO 10_0856]MDX8031076.1 SdrD B-like domain-containing protein [Lentzea sp. BCCO 10_0856]
MSSRPVGRALLRFGALTTAAVLAFGGIAATALAQEADPSAPVSTTATPPAETTTPPPASETPPPVTTEPPTTELPKTAEPPRTTEPAKPAEPPKTAEQPAKVEKVAETGGVNALVYVDADHDGAFDEGEAMKDVMVSITAKDDPARHYSKFTDTSGRVQFTDLPTGGYGLYYQPPTGWTVLFPPGGRQVAVEANKTAQLTAVAERLLMNRLTATLTLDQKTYAYPATARITVTLTNTGDYPITDLEGVCDRTPKPGSLGTGQGWDVLRGAGVTLAAGEQRVIVIDEAVPEGARDVGEAELSCVFGQNVADNYGVWVLERVQVTGGKGTKTMYLVDGQGRAIGGTKITLLDKETGAEVASAESGLDGKVVFSDVTVGRYNAVSAPPWAFSKYGEPLDVHVYKPGSTTTHTMVPAPTSKASLRTTLEFDKPNYLSYETMRLKFTITNVGAETAQKVRLPWKLIGNPIWDPTDYGPIDPSASGLTIAPGETKTVVAVSPISDWQREPYELKLSYYLDYTGRVDTKDDWFSGSTVITFVDGDVQGVLYGDANHNGVQDPGEALAGAEVRISRSLPRLWATRTTDAEGRFRFEDAPAGRWYLRYTINGWTVPDDPAVNTVLVTPEGVDLTVRAERSISAVLQPRMTFDKSSYQPGESARITVALTNTGDRPVSGVTAACIGYDESYLDVGPEWGDLATGGATVGAGETRTFTVVEQVPEGARQFGEVQARCRFGPDAARRSDLPETTAWASVPGAFGSVNVRLFHDKNNNVKADDGEGVRSARFVLRAWFSNEVVTEAVPDENGVVRMPRVPAGPYKASIEGRWKYVYETQGDIKVVGDRVISRDILLVPDETKDPWPPTPAAPDKPAGPGAAAPRPSAPPLSAEVVLAKTGVSVLGIGLVGALLVAFGIGARTASRNREAQARGRA